METQVEHERPSGINRWRWASAIAVGLDGYNLLAVSAAAIPLERTFHLTSFNATVIATGTLLGALIGGAAAGWTTDRIGRRPVLVWDLRMFVVFSLASALAWSPIVLIISRVLLGIAIGADYAVSPTYIAEMAETRDRGRQLGLMWLLWPLGATASFAWAGLLFPLLPIDIGWRALLGVSVVPAVLALLLRRGMPESSRFLRVKDRVPEAVPLQEPLRFQQGVRSRWILAVGPWFCLAVASYGLGLVLPAALSEGGVTGMYGAIWGAGLVNIAGIAGSAWAMVRLDRRGRRPMQITGFAGAAVIVWLIAVWMGAGLRHYSVILALLMAGQLVSQYGPGTVTGIYPAELFPTRRRASALGVATAVSRMGGIAGALLLDFVNTAVGFPGMLWVAGSFMASGALITIILAKETKNLRLEEISADFG